MKGGVSFGIAPLDIHALRKEAAELDNIIAHCRVAQLLDARAVERLRRHPPREKAATAPPRPPCPAVCPDVLEWTHGETTCSHYSIITNTINKLKTSAPP
eukprot:6145796-Prymnesium_polylepis.1